MELYLAGNTRGNSDSLLPANLIGLYNILLPYGHSYGLKGGDEIIEIKKNVELYFAGEGWGKSCDFLYSEGYGRLLSYINNRQRAENYIFHKRWDNFMRDFKIYLAGDTRGFPDAVPEKLIDDFNILLSYIHPTGPKGVDKVGEVKRAAVVDYILTDMAKMTEEERKAFMDLYFAGTENFSDEMRDKYIMDLYLVGPEKENIMEVVTGEVKANMLFNYLEGKKATDKYKEKIKPKKLFIDSGAFSAWTRGKQIDVDEYINWINERADFIDLYGQVDVIPGDRVKGHTQEQVAEAARATWENYLYMRPKMKNPDGLLYTFHVGEPYNYLREALEWTDEDGKHIPYIALGGMVGKPTPVKKAFLDSCFNIIEKSSNPKVKTHAFGMTSFPLLEQYPITSADSTSWIMTGATGSIMTDVGIIAVSDQMAKLPEHYSHLPKHHQETFNELISEFGFTLDELRESRDNRIMFNARYMNKKANALQYRPGPKKLSLF